MQKGIWVLKSIIITAAALACGGAGAEDLTVSSDMELTTATNVDAVVFSNNATLTLTQGDKQYLTFKTMTGTGKIVMNDGAYIQNDSSAEATIPDTVTIEVVGTTSWANRLSGNNKALKVYGPLTGSGDVYLNFTSGQTGAQLYGDNSNFTGTIYLDGNGNTRDKFGAAQAGGDNLRLVFLGNAKDNGSTLFSNGTIHFGSIYTKSIANDQAYWRSMNQGNTFILGALNSEDDRLTLTMGDADNADAKIVKVGTGRLEIGDTRHHGGTIISNGVLQVASPDALCNNNSPIAFDGGTLAYGTNLYTEAHEAVTKDYSALVKDSHGAISIDTIGHDVTWASGSLQTNNPDAQGVDKKGSGTLRLSSYEDGTVNFFTDAKYTNRIEEGTLEIINMKRATTKYLVSKILGTGTLRIYPFQDKGGWRIQANGALEEFEGTVDFANDQPTAAADGKTTAFGFLSQGSDLNLSNLRWSFTGMPTTDTEIVRNEVNSGKTLTFGALDVLSEHAQLYFNNTINIVIAGTHGDSMLNGQFTNKAIKFTKNGTGKLTIGPGFSVVEGSTFTVKEGTLELPKGVTYAATAAKFDTFTIAEGVALCGEGTFDAVDLSQHDLVFPTEVVQGTTYTLLTATSVSGAYTDNVKDALAALNTPEVMKHGHWKLSQVTKDGVTKVVLTYAKNGFNVIVR